MSYKNYSSIRNTKGFTLIELLVVIALLGVLAAAVLVLINPVEQLARGRDSGRKSSVSQLGRTVSAYYTNFSAYPNTNTWNTDLTTNTGELKTFPTNTAGVAGCGVNQQNGFCYNQNGTDAVVFTHLESKSEVSKCANVVANTWYVWSSAEGRAGVYCGGSAPQPGVNSSNGLLAN